MTVQQTHSPDVSTMLAHRLRRWPNIVPTLSERLVFAGCLESINKDHILSVPNTVTDPEGPQPTPPLSDNKLPKIDLHSQHLYLTFKIYSKIIV